MNATASFLILIFILHKSVQDDDKWDPRTDECHVKISAFLCKPIINGRIESDESSIQADLNNILDNDDRDVTIDILSKRNSLQRKAIDELYKAKYATEEKSELFDRFSVSKDEPPNMKLYGDLIYALLEDVRKQYALYLWSSASISQKTNLHLYHDSMIFMAILGCTSKTGLKYLNHALHHMGDPDNHEENNNFEDQMRVVGKYPENFIDLVMKLLNGVRNDSTTINQKMYDQDLKDLRENLDTEKENRDENEELLRELLTQRNFTHLRKLFGETGIHDFEKLFPTKYKDEFIGNAIMELYYIIMNRFQWFAKMLKKYRSKSYYVIFIIVTRLEIDFGNIKQIFERETGQQLSDVIKEVYNDTNEMYTKGLLNLINPPEEIASTSYTTIDVENDSEAT